MINFPYSPTENTSKASPKFLDIVLDLGSTIANILTICGVENAKAAKAVSSITNAFLNFDEKQTGDCGMYKIRYLKKDKLLQNLRGSCCMSKAEAKLTASVVKCAFRAFYHKQSVRKYDPAYYSENDWKSAATRTISVYAKAGATKSELELATRRIQEAYESYLERVSYKWPQESKSSCKALTRTNMVKPAINEISRQVLCTCCGCLKASPASYRDSKGRSILLAEENNLYYNTQVMKNEVGNLKTAGTRGQFQEPTCQENLSRELFKMTQDMINRIIKCEKTDTSLYAYSEGENTLKLVNEKNSGVQVSRGRQSQFPKYDKNSKKSSAHCDCGENHNFTLKRLKKNSATSSGLRIPKNSCDEYCKDYHQVKTNLKPVVEISLEGVYRCENRHNKIDIIGLKLVESKGTDPSEFVCKRIVGKTNRYTQTGGSTGVSKCSSSKSLQETGYIDNKQSMTPDESKSLNGNFDLSNPVSLHTANEDDVRSLDEYDNQLPTEKESIQLEEVPIRADDVRSEENPIEDIQEGDFGSKMNEKIDVEQEIMNETVDIEVQSKIEVVIEKPPESLEIIEVVEENK